MAQPWELVVAILIRKCQRPGCLVGHHGAFCALQWTSGSDRRLNLAREHLRVSPGAGRHPGFDAGAVCQFSQ